VNDLIPLAETIAARLKARRESIAIAESSTGGLISAALLAVHYSISRRVSALALRMPIASLI
jgi:nicotinamide mononucleotide (NMN) deamidase PncC